MAKRRHKKKYSEPFRPITLKLPTRLIEMVRRESPKGIFSEGLFKILRRHGVFNIKTAKERDDKRRQQD